jgi:hypothetical protein
MLNMLVAIAVVLLPSPSLLAVVYIAREAAAILAANAAIFNPSQEFNYPTYLTNIDYKPLQFLQSL